MRLAMVSACDPTLSSMSCSTKWMLCSALTSSDYTGSDKSFVWNRMLPRDAYFLRKSRKPALISSVCDAWAMSFV